MVEVTEDTSLDPEVIHLFSINIQNGSTFEGLLLDFADTPVVKALTDEQIEELKRKVQAK